MSKHVPAYSLFIEDPSGPCAALEWFRHQTLVPQEETFHWGSVLLYPSVGELKFASDGSVDAERSPVITVHVPKIRRGILWTVGEVRFCSMPLDQFPKLKALRRSFLRWIDQHPLIYDHHPNGPHEFDYYLEGSAKNRGAIRALPSGMSALRAERYFVSRLDGSLDKVCKTLALRGIQCADSEQGS